MEERAERKESRREWFLYMIVLPLLFTVILTAVLLQVLGFNVSGQLLKWGSSAPYVGQLLSGPEEMSETQTEPTISERLEALKEEQAIQVRQYEEAIREKDEQIDLLTSEIEQLKLQLEQSEARHLEQLREKDVAELYAAMSPSRAAPIMEEMSIEEIARLLSLLKKEERSLILARLNPETAAKVTMELLKGEEKESS